MKMLLKEIIYFGAITEIREQIWVISTTIWKGETNVSKKISNFTKREMWMKWIRSEFAN